MNKFSKYHIFDRLKNFLRNGFTPKWVIFSIDIIINSIIFALFFSFWRFMSASGVPYTEDFLLLYSIFLGSTTLVGLVFRTYNSVLRYHGLKDTLKLLSVTGCAFFILFFTLKFSKIFPYRDSTLFLLVFAWEALSFFAMFIFRVVVGFLYFLWMGNKTSKNKRVAIYGVGVASVGSINVIKSGYSNILLPVVLFSPKNNVSNKMIDGIPISSISKDTLEASIRKYRIEVFVFFSTQLDDVRENYADILLRNNVELMMMNLMDPFSYDGGGVGTLKKIEIEDLLGRETIKLDNKIVKERINNNTVLVTGGAGSIGSEIVRQVCLYGCKRVVVFDIAETPLNSIWLEIKENFKEVDIVPIVGDVSDREHVEYVFSIYKPTITYHAAAYKHVPMMEMYPTQAVKVNIGGSKNVADMAVKYASHMVMISTDKAVNPTNVMGASKRIAELYVQSIFYSNKEEIRNIPNAKYPRLVITRFGNVLGSNGSVVPLFKSQIEKGGPITVTHRDVIRYFMTIKEACSLVLEAGCMGKGGEVFVFDMGEQVRIYDLAEKMIRLSGKRPHVDIKIEEIGLRDGEKLYEELLANNDNSVSTYNKKILIAQLSRVDYSLVNEYVNVLMEKLDTKDNMEIVRYMKKIVPEYKSNQSIYEKLDK